MNLAGRMLQWYAPAFVRRRALQELFRATADAFGVSMPPANHTSADELLAKYAAFTAEQATTLLGSGTDLAPVRRQLFDSAYMMGARLRRVLGVASTADTLAVARLVYRLLRIDFHPTGRGEIEIRQCYFSRFYTASVCELISALDRGLLAGLSAGGRLDFRQRITEGAPCCTATFAEAST